MSTTVLIVEDNQTLREGIVHVLQKMGFSVSVAVSAEEGLEVARKDRPGLAICDYKLPGISGIQFLQKVKVFIPQIEVLIMTAYGTIELAVDAMRKGAYDFLTKPFTMEELRLKIERMSAFIRQKSTINTLTEKMSYLREQIDTQFNDGEIIGAAKVMQEIYRTIGKVAQTDTTILISGESGTGKELVARAIHAAGNRKDQPLIKVNCSVLNENLLESELFGHEKGAFTGATRKRKGRFELADGGTLFLDEIGEISMNMQLKLLRVLQEKEFERVGGEETFKVDVRIIAATNKDLKNEVKENRFREDLFYRLNIVPVHIPPLRERREDIPLLVEHFLHKIGATLGKPDYKFSEEALRCMQEYHWPGNVREVENAVERALVLTEHKTIFPSLLPFDHDAEKMDGETDVLVQPGIIHLQQAVDQVEEILIKRALQFTHGNKAAAARMLGLKSNTFFYKLNRYELGS
ncbi:MAG TPA: sigma-54-dependent Fis family transcriptional regulator [Bacteroidetes bacterium]|nr:sigma-54-dependent Fis family transcriptional regulator [Bacteroidota bacterium]